MDRLNFSHFYYFYIVAKEGSIKSAAEKLFVSQPTISDQIKLLEEFFESKLFIREHRQLSLTGEGKLALEYAEEIFSKSRELTSRLRNDIKLPKTSFDIGMTPYMGQYFLYDFIMPLFEQKDYTVNLKQDSRHILLAELEEGNIDMIFTDEKDSLPSGFNTYKVGHNKTFVVAHKKFRKFKRGFPESLTDIPYYAYNSNESKLKYEIDVFFRQHNITPRIIGEGDDIDLFQTVTEKGLAFSIVPESAKTRFCMNKDVIVLGEIEELQTTVWGVLKLNERGLGYQFLKGKLA
jgi:LysR family transcriptional activator of nhaA